MLGGMVILKKLGNRSFFAFEDELLIEDEYEKRELEEIRVKWELATLMALTIPKTIAVLHFSPIRLTIVYARENVVEELRITSTSKR